MQSMAQPSLNVSSPMEMPAKPGNAARLYTAETYRPEESAAYLMRQILTAATQEVDRQLAPADLTNAQWVPLYKLYLGQASTAAELARVCLLDAGAMTRTLDRLEHKGLCQRKRSEEDRRVVHIVLTEAGELAAKAIPRVLCDVQNAHLEGFSVQELEQLKSFLRRILHNTKHYPHHASQAPQADDVTPKAHK